MNRYCFLKRIIKKMAQQLHSLVKVGHIGYMKINLILSIVVLNLFLSFGDKSDNIHMLNIFFYS